MLALGILGELWYHCARSLLSDVGSLWRYGVESPNDLRRRFWDWLKHPQPRTLFPLLGGILLFLLILLLHDLLNDVIHAINANILVPFFGGSVLPWLRNNASLPTWVPVLLIVVTVAALALSMILLLIRAHPPIVDPPPANDHVTRLEAELADRRENIVVLTRQLQEEQATSSDSLEVLTKMVRGLEQALKVFLEVAQVSASGLPPERIERIASVLLPILMEEMAKLYKGNVFREGILIRDADGEDRDHLWWYATNDLTPAKIPVKKYYIGDQSVERRSVAGEAWRTGEPQRCHVDNATGNGDHPAYVRSRSLRPGEYTYKSFVTLPLCEDFLWSEQADSPSGGLRSGKECLGILCLDSSKSDTFDNDVLLTNPMSDAFAKPYLRAMFRVLEWTRSRTGS